MEQSGLQKNEYFDLIAISCNLIAINCNQGSIVTILSSSLIFLSIWLVDKQQERKEQWNEVQIAAMLLKETDEQSEAEIDME